MGRGTQGDDPLLLPPLDPEGPRQTGRFVFHVADERWEWDDDVFALHGYTPGEVEPTTELIMQHKHEQDRELVERTLQEAIGDGAPFNVYYRIRVAGTVRNVVLCGEGQFDAGRTSGKADRLVGYYLDLTPEL